MDRKYKIAYMTLIICFGTWMIIGQFIPYFEGLLLTSVEIAYECKDKGKTLKDCERQVRDALR